MTDQERENEKLRELIENALPEITKRMGEWRQEQESTKAVLWYDETWSHGKTCREHSAVEKYGTITLRHSGWELITNNQNEVIIKTTCPKNAKRIMGMQKLVKAVKEYMGHNYHHTYEAMQTALREMGEEL